MHLKVQFNFNTVINSCNDIGQQQQKRNVEIPKVGENLILFYGREKLTFLFLASFHVAVANS